MSSSTTNLRDLEAQWFRRLAEMRAAISELKIPEASFQATLYGEELKLSDKDFSTSPVSENLWDLISDDSDDSDDITPNFGLENPAASTDQVRGVYDYSWLLQQMRSVALKGTGLQADVIADQVIALISSSNNGNFLCSSARPVNR